MNIQKGVLLKDHTTFKIGGPAEYFAEVTEIDELKEVLQWARDKNQPVKILGGGTNLLISDQGLKGLIIKLKLNKLEFDGNKVTVGAGVLLAYLLNQSLEHGLVGLEFAAGVPGTVGGGVRGNAGTFGQAMGDRVKKIKYIDADLEIAEIDDKEAQFAYRHSIFKEEPWIILEVELELQVGDTTKSRELVKERLLRRKDTQPNQPSAGCIFKNVRFADVDLEKLKAKNIEVEKFEEFQKIPAAYLIEKAGLKGHTIGDAQISEVHANYIINKGNATAEQVIMMISFIKQQIRDKYGIQLLEEVQILV